MWELLDAGTDTRATEIPGLGVLVGVPGMGLTMVHGARLRMLKDPIDGATHQITRDERTNPPLVSGKSAKEIRDGQPQVPDPGAMVYYTQDEPEF